MSLQDVQAGLLADVFEDVRVGHDRLGAIAVLSRDTTNMRRWRELDLPMLKWRRRSMYDARSTFIAIERGPLGLRVCNAVSDDLGLRAILDG